jgi:hypothetical protein
MVCGMLAFAAYADVKGAVTNQTRDIVLQEEFEQIVGAGQSEDEGSSAQIPVSDPGVILVEELRKNDFEVAITADKPDGSYKIGDKIKLSVTSSKDAYLTLLDFTPSGQIVVLFPNAWVADNSVKAGEKITVPVDDTQYSLRAGGPVGVDVIKAIVTDKQVQVYDEANKDVAGPFSILKDAVAATRDILLMAEPSISENTDNANDDVKWGVASYAIMTGEEGNDAPTGFSVAGKAGWQIKMWANNNNYLIGERVFVKFLSNKSGKLVSLVNAGASSKQNDLLPEGTDVVFNAGEILTLPRAEDKWKLVAAEDAGDDTLAAKLALEDGTELDIELKLVVTNDLEG